MNEKDFAFLMLGMFIGSFLAVTVRSVMGA